MPFRYNHKLGRMIHEGPSSVETTIYQTDTLGKFVRVAPPQGDEANPNFVITCNYGDWSGFRTLSECQAQFRELESNLQNKFRVDPENQRKYWFRVVQR